MQRFISVARRVKGVRAPYAAAFSTKPMRDDEAQPLKENGSLQKAFMRSVKPTPFKKEVGGAEAKNVNVKEAPAKVEEEKKAQMMPKVDVAPVNNAEKQPMNPAAVAADLFVKQAVNTNLQEFAPRICVVGVGGGGCNAINNMVARGLSGVEFICTNTDAQHLSTTLTDKRIQLGRTFTEELGCGKCSLLLLFSPSSSFFLSFFLSFAVLFSRLSHPPPPPLFIHN